MPVVKCERVLRQRCVFLAALTLCLLLGTFPKTTGRRICIYKTRILLGAQLSYFVPKQNPGFCYFKGRAVLSPLCAHLVGQQSQQCSSEGSSVGFLRFLFSVSKEVFQILPCVFVFLFVYIRSALWRLTKKFLLGCLNMLNMNLRNSCFFHCGFF